METSLNETSAPRWTRAKALALGAGLAAFFSALAFVNCRWVRYPQDNDLDEVGWLAAHLTFSRPESFANQGYPPGMLVLLRLISPLIGSLLSATFLWQSIAATACVYFVYRVARNVSRHESAGPLAALCAAFACLPVATCEFADGTSTALFFAGLWALTERAADRRGFFLFGLATGFSYLFRTHYLMLLVLVPGSAFLAGFGLRTTASALLPFVGGFAASAWPLWLLNLLAYGTPLHAGVSQYNIALAVIPNAFNWEDYPNTYNQWPVSRILREQPGALFHHAFDTLVGTLSLQLSVTGAWLGAFAIALASARRQRQQLAFMAVLALLYTVIIIVPTRFTDRAYAPVAMLASVLVGGGLAELVALTSRPRLSLLGSILAISFVTLPMGVWVDLKARREARRFNERVVNALLANGMHSSGEVFTNIWNVYNLADPGFVTFYNYGGWIELDSEYARERPHPTADTPSEWQAFFAQHHIHFAILTNRRETRELFKHPPSGWRAILEDRSATVWALPPEPEPAKAPS
jgi:hypothetical protein